MLLGILAADRIGRIKTFKLVSPLVLVSVTLLAVCVTSGKIELQFLFLWPSLALS